MDHSYQFVSRGARRAVVPAGKMDSDGEDTPPLLRAAYAGDVHALRRAIADGADLRGSGEFGAFSPFRGESGRGEALSGSFLGREGPQKSTPYPGFKLEFKKTHLKSKNST